MKEPGSNFPGSFVINNTLLKTVDRKQPGNEKPLYFSPINTERRNALLFYLLPVLILPDNETLTNGKT